MTKTTTNLLLMLITILAGTYFYITCCSECGVSVEEEPPMEAVIPVSPEVTSYPFAFSDGDYGYNRNDNYNFINSSSSILIPLSANADAGVSSLKSIPHPKANIPYPIESNAAEEGEAKNSRTVATLN